MTALRHEVPSPPKREDVLNEWKREGRPDKFVMNDGGACYFTVNHIEGQFYVCHSLCLDIFSQPRKTDERS